MEERKEKSIEVKVTADGKAIPIKGFVQGFIGYTILGMLQGLKGTPPTPKEVTVSIKVNEKA